MRRRAIIGAIIGAIMGCLVGALTEFRQAPNVADNPYLESVNQNTGKPQLHVAGKPEIK